MDLKLEHNQSKITAKVVADSICNGSRITTYELEYHRYIHGEFMTHREISKNAASSRAIPVKKSNERIRSNPAIPTSWGKNQSGMTAAVDVSEDIALAAYNIWIDAIESATRSADALADLGIHKQVTNRLPEPGSMIKVVMTGTKLNNFFWLRDHSDAQPEMQELARCMRIARSHSTPIVLRPGEWHLPYVRTEDINGIIHYFDENDDDIDAETGKKISSSCCAQVSYRKNDPSEEKALDIYQKLIGSDHKHASPFEHQATPIDYSIIEKFNPATWPEGITHVTRNGDLCSGNFNHWIQHRQLIPGHTVWG